MTTEVLISTGWVACDRGRCVSIALESCWNLRLKATAHKPKAFYAVMVRIVTDQVIFPSA